MISPKTITVTISAKSWQVDLQDTPGSIDRTLVGSIPQVLQDANSEESLIQVWESIMVLVQKTFVLDALKTQGRLTEPNV